MLIIIRNHPEIIRGKAWRKTGTRHFEPVIAQAAAAGNLHEIARCQRLGLTYTPPCTCSDHEGMEAWDGFYSDSIKTSIPPSPRRRPEKGGIKVKGIRGAPG